MRPTIDEIVTAYLKAYGSEPLEEDLAKDSDQEDDPDSEEDEEEDDVSSEEAVSKAAIHSAAAGCVAPGVVRGARLVCLEGIHRTALVFWIRP